VHRSIDTTTSPKFGREANMSRANIRKWSSRLAGPHPPFVNIVAIAT